jgi:hypothetical protein
METMDLNGDMEGSTPIDFSQPPPTPQIKEREKNIHKVQMDSTPINDVMGADWETSSMDAPMGPPPTMPPNYAPQQSQGRQMAKKANPMNLTDEQMEALLAGLVATVAFSKPVQEKLGGMVPQVAADPGSVTSMITMGLVASIIFYFGKRVVMP